MGQQTSLYLQIRQPGLLLLLLLLSYAATAQTVYITRTGEKYHSASCQYLSKSKISILLDSAKVKGYTACSVCKPAGRITPTQGQTQPTVSRQCSGITKAGARCKRMTTDASGRCYQH